MDSFTTETYGKWILAGEHSVLRGGQALVFPLKSLSVQFSHEQQFRPSQFVYRGSLQSEYEFVCAGLLDRALKKLGKHKSDIEGKVTLESNLPLGSGLGASATLCAIIAKWMAFLGWISQQQVPLFAVELEDVFHGESSGVDIAVALECRPLVYSRKDLRGPDAPQLRALDIQWKPNLYLLHSEERGITSNAVQKVKSQCAPQIDQQMNQSVEMCLRAITQRHAGSESELVQGIELANNCFERWDLYSEGMRQAEVSLRQEGALAVKPTGSGGGGHLLALFPEAFLPSPHTKTRLISCWD